MAWPDQSVKIAALRAILKDSLMPPKESGNPEQISSAIVIIMQQNGTLNGSFSFNLQKKRLRWD